jgi:hypothetical protein
VDLADFVNDVCVEQDALGRRRLAGVDVRNNSNISCLME